MAAYFVDDRSGIVLLFLGRKPCSIIENKTFLSGSAPPLFGLRDRRDELRAAARFKNLLRGLPRLIKLPMPRRAIIRRGGNQGVKEWIGHGQYFSATLAMLRGSCSVAAIAFIMWNL